MVALGCHSCGYLTLQLLLGRAPLPPSPPSARPPVALEGRIEPQAVQAREEAWSRREQQTRDSRLHALLGGSGQISSLSFSLSIYLYLYLYIHALLGGSGQISSSSSCVPSLPLCTGACWCVQTLVQDVLYTRAYKLSLAHRLDVPPLLINIAAQLDPQGPLL